MKRGVFFSFITLMSILTLSIQNVYAHADLKNNIYQTEENGEDGGEEDDTGEDGTEEQSNPALSISAPSALLMEASTGTVLYDKNPNEKLRPASVTKIMTLLLIFDALEAGKIKLDDIVTVSEYAASMGGSQVFLEPFEQQTVDTMIKCIAIASANDACVAMAELICGSEEEFVSQMNQRAKGLGMENTNFVNCNGLDTDGHVTTAYDIALMSRELINKYPEIRNYSTVWMDTITHVTKKGSSEFGLTNTNKLIKQYEWATGLKTGSTSLAKYCVSATAEKDGIDMIAVIMAAPDYKVRFQDAMTLLNYGYAVTKIYADENTELLPKERILGAIEEYVALAYKEPFYYLDTQGNDLTAVEKEIELPEELHAPVKEGDKAGKAVYKLNGNEIGSVDIIYKDSVDKAGFWDYFYKTFTIYTI